jgi:hypothetical protein
MWPVMDGLLVCLFALVGAGVSQAIGGGDTLVVLGSFVGALAGTAVALLPFKARKNATVVICLGLLLILSLVPMQSLVTVCVDCFPQPSAALHHNPSR